jgi:hypothetical protein
MADLEQLEILKKGAVAWNEWRQKNPDTSIDLSGANLSGADLSEANLYKANLSGAKLVGAGLQVAELIRAELIGANLSWAKLDLANLNSAGLSRADLSGASLYWANLLEANLDGTLLNEARLGWTVFAQTSLKTAKGLESCNHDGPSSLDYQTLIVSGPLPEIFLRGCGLPDEFIDHLRVAWSNPIEFYSGFISYSHEDKSFARRLHDALQGRGIRCWLDEHQILAGDKIHRAVDEGLSHYDKVLLCCSEASLKSWWVDTEVQKALMKEERLSKERGKDVLAIIPLNLDGSMFKPEWQDWKKDILTSRATPDFTGWKNDDDKFNAQLGNVVKALRADAKARARPPKARL